MPKGGLKGVTINDTFGLEIQLHGDLISPLVYQIWELVRQIQLLSTRATEVEVKELNPTLFEALQLLKSAYRNGHISAAGIAARHIDALIAELDDDFGYDELLADGSEAD
ncbi:hypothetical protein B0H17DRAFT_1190307 [Mycena rosella]|uniref:Uncharacterized protein n=1 Tax=Mycena rosella TaxID=1033263 RepID=A0AAD7H2W4_MYCRO|nr:hypothetical protein B0H17DRAFT_1190307 [Mycena rosella]